MPLIETKGAASAQGFGEFAASSGAVTYIEDVFSTYLYTGNGSTQTITNGIDLSTKGGLTWLKQRNDSVGHRLYDTVRGATKLLESNGTAAQSTSSTGLTAFTSSGFSLGNDPDSNTNNGTYASWTFREQPKFFDVVTYTGTGSNTTISHSLGSVPACIMVKRTDTTGDWQVYHSSLANTEYLVLNTTAAKATGATRWNSTTPTSTVFSIGTDATVNASGGTYVAYLFAHDAGGFGLTGTDNVISCGSYTTDGAGVGSATLGWEPQWLLLKVSSGTGGWVLIDNMRGFVAPGGGNSANLLANTSAAEGTIGIKVNATGFTDPGVLVASGTVIYIAIRRGPMKVPTSGTSVFSPQTFTEIITNPTTLTTGWPTDLHLISRRTETTTFYVADRLRGSVLGNENFLETPSTVAETDYSSSPPLFTSNTGIVITNLFNNISGQTDISYQFRRAPGFFDVVCYTGTGSARTVTHNLGVVPEMMIVKGRSQATVWRVYSQALGATNYLVLNNTDKSEVASTLWNDTAPTSSVFTVGTSGSVNDPSANYVAYLFASCAGVSKVGSYTGTGTTKQVDCGFTGGARFVLIKRTDSTGAWYVWDTARGIVSGNDPYLLLNSTDAEVTNTDYVDTYSAGFEISSTAPAAINASGGTFIFLAIA